jgi:hypothetical protein
MLRSRLPESAAGAEPGRGLVLAFMTSSALVLALLLSEPALPAR